MNKRVQPRGADDVERVTHAVLAASRLLVAMSVRSLAAVEERVTLPQFRMLVVLSTNGAVKLVTLAERLGVSPSTAMRMNDRLVAAGLVDRRVNPENRRENVLSLTPAGHRLVQRVTSRRREEIAAVVERMPAEQREALVSALTAFAQAGGDLAAAEGREPYPLGWTDPGDGTKG